MLAAEQCALGTKYMTVSGNHNITRKVMKTNNNFNQERYQRKVLVILENRFLCSYNSCKSVTLF